MFRLSFCGGIIQSSLRNQLLSSQTVLPPQCTSSINLTKTIRAASLPTLTQAKCMSFYHGREGSELWKVMTSVSPQGKKRGRGHRLGKQKDLNYGQKPGFGKAKISWPGLTTNSLVKQSGDKKMEAAEIGKISDSDYQEYWDEMLRDQQYQQSKRMRSGMPNPLERGWTAAKPGGRRFGPPKSLEADRGFEGFESILLQYKTLNKMTGNLGRVKRHSILMVTGNGNGTVGFTLKPGKYGKGRKNFIKATNKAGLNLVTIDRFENRTVFHDFFTQFGQSKVFVRQAPPGYGINAHRAIKAICDLAGIKDLSANCEGNVKNTLHVAKAFLLGLLRQKTHQVLADEKQLHLVEMRAENDFFPKIIASPSNGKVRTKEEIDHNEILDFEMISYEGKVPDPKPGFYHKYKGTPGWEKHLRTRWAYNAHDRVRRRMRVENGEEWGAVRSHLYPKYPECVEVNWKQRVADHKAKKMGGGDDY